MRRVHHDGWGGGRKPSVPVEKAIGAVGNTTEARVAEAGSTVGINGATFTDFAFNASVTAVNVGFRTTSSSSSEN